MRQQNLRSVLTATGWPHTWEQAGKANNPSPHGKNVWKGETTLILFTAAFTENFSQWFTSTATCNGTLLLSNSLCKNRVYSISNLLKYMRLNTQVNVIFKCCMHLPYKWSLAVTIGSSIGRCGGYCDVNVIVKYEWWIHVWSSKEVYHWSENTLLWAEIINEHA